MPGGVGLRCPIVTSVLGWQDLPFSHCARLLEGAVGSCVATCAHSSQAAEEWAVVLCHPLHCSEHRELPLGLQGPTASETSRQMLKAGHRVCRIPASRRAGRWCTEEARRREKEAIAGCTSVPSAPETHRPLGRHSVTPFGPARPAVGQALCKVTPQPLSPVVAAPKGGSGGGGAPANGFVIRVNIPPSSSEGHRDTRSSSPG